MAGPRRAAPTPEAIDAAAAAIRAGGLVAFPTDTVYGLGADATDDRAVARVFEAKRRPQDKPLIVLAASLAMADDCVRLDATAKRLAQAFWPGPLTLVLARATGSGLSPLVNPLGTTVALRIPANETALDLIRAAGRPLTAPSANPTGAPSPRTAAEVARTLGHALDYILDGGPATASGESTLLDLTADEPRLLRRGACAEEDIARVIGPVRTGP